MNNIKKNENEKNLLTVNKLRKWFPVNERLFFKKNPQYIKAVDGVSFRVKEGETFGLVGESGCGKSTVGRTILRLLEPTSGEINFDGKDIVNLKPEEMRAIRKDMQIIFQDPFASLNPRMKVGDIVSEPYLIHKIVSKEKANKKAKEILEMVGIRPDNAKRFPHEFSGGQRQRICIARALAVNPRLIICDESVSALDVSIQAQILNLLEELQEKLKLTYIFISHDLSVVKHISSKVAVMYLGRIVEIADKNEIFKNPMHPYTKALLSAVPIPDPTKKVNRVILKGDVPSPINPPSGCPFHTRCNMAKDICSNKEPIFEEKHSEHFCSCHFAI